MSFVLEFAAKGVAAGIGLAAEGIHNHKEKKRAKSQAARTNSDNDVNPPNRSDGQLARISELNGDEATWHLDEVQNDLVPLESREEEPQQKEKETRNLVLIIDEWILKYPPPSFCPGVPTPKISLPVILPQRRPRARARGFVRAYAPVLMQCGIHQPMFIEFLENFNKSTEANPWLSAINLAALAGNFIPHGLGNLLTIAVYISVTILQEMDGRSRTSTYLDLMNTKFFRPRGLFCLILTWNPESSAAHTSVDITSTIATKTEGGTHGIKKMHTSYGNTYRDFEFPEAAPLVFPALEELAEQDGEEAQTTVEKSKAVKGFTSDYYDRRARAEYAVHHPDSLLAQGPQDKFYSRYADPNHPASSGNLWSLVTEGRFNPPPLGDRNGGGLLGLGNMGGYGRQRGGYGYGSGHGYDRFGGVYGGRYEGPLGERIAMGRQLRGNQNQHSTLFDPGVSYAGGNAYTGPNTTTTLTYGAGPLELLAPLGKVFKKVMGKNVLYLMIVNMPSDKEMNIAKATTEKAGVTTGSGVRYDGPESSTYHQWSYDGAESRYEQNANPPAYANSFSSVLGKEHAHAEVSPVVPEKIF